MEHAYDYHMTVNVRVVVRVTPDEDAVTSSW